MLSVLAYGQERPERSTVNRVLKETDPANLAAGTNPEKGIDKNEKNGASKLFGSARVGGGSRGSADGSGEMGAAGGGSEEATAKAATPTAQPASEWQAVSDPNTGMTYYHNTTTG